MNIPKHVGLFGCIFCSVCALRLLYAGHYAANLQAAADRASARRSREIEAAWQRRAYCPFSAESVLRAALATAPVSTLTPPQRIALTARLNGVLAYLADPSAEKYYRLKTSGLHWAFAPQGRAATLLTGILKERRGGLAAADTRTVVRLMWERAAPAPAFGAPRLTAVCMDSILGGLARTNAPASLLTGPVKNGFTASYDSIDPGFVYIGYANTGPPLLFELSFLAKANGGNSAGPIYISLLWIQGDQDWAPNRLMIDDWLHVRTVF